MKKSVRSSSLAAAAVVAGLLSVFAVGGAANAADPEIIGEGHVTLNFSTTPGSVDITIWTHNLSTVEAWGAAVVRDIDGVNHPTNLEHYDPGQEKTFFRSLPGYTCADLGKGAVAFAFGFGSLSNPEPDWIGAPLSYPDPRITVVGCDVVPNPTGGDPDPAPPTTTPPVVTPGSTTPPAGGTTTPTTTVTTTSTGTNTLPAAKTDGADLAGATSTASPVFGLAVTVGALLAAAAGSVIAGALRRR
ncbi:hypothetical protein AAIB33_17160 [Microbacterium sp. AZCO]|uniref:hypothetical protein n=1 Tax=Microbacterium sp. AZCO TaxID=3142976 RepID=UPI0031F3B0EC